MFEVFRLYMEKKLGINPGQFDQLQSLLTAKALRKGESLLHTGDICKYTAFVEKGCLRSYVIDTKGKEHTINFAPENWWITDQNSIKKQVPAIFNVEAVEDSEVLLMEGDIIETLDTVVNGAANMFLTLSQNSMYASQKRLVNLLSASADERYLDFIETYPSLALRLPQKMIASYIGVAPESLSRIRGQLLMRR